MLEKRNLALNIDDEYLVISGCALSPDDLVRLGMMLRVVLP